MKQSMTWLAIYAVALHVILLGLVPFNIASANPADPLSAICHSVALADTSSGEAPAKSGLIPGHVCEHCNLCNAMAPPQAPDAAFVSIVMPVRVLHVLRPYSTAAWAGTTSNPSLARGPPLFA